MKTRELMTGDGYTLDQLHHMEADALLRYHALVNSADWAEDHNEKLAAIWDEVVTYRELITDHETAQIATSDQAESDQSVADVIAVHVAADELAAQEKAEAAYGVRVKEVLGRGCGLTGAIAAVIACIVVFFVFLADDDDTDAKCSSPTTTLGGVEIQLVADDCEPTPTATPSDTLPDPTGSGTTGSDGEPPDDADLPAGQVLYQGTSGDQLGCIACDGQSRFINILRSTMAKGDAERIGQEIVWPENGTVVDFGIRIPQPNEGRYGINLYVNGGYSVGCPIEIGSRSCRVLAGQEPSPLAAGDRVTIIVGEQGIVDDSGVPVEEGDFVMQWWFVFQPE